MDFKIFGMLLAALLTVNCSSDTPRSGNEDTKKIGQTLNPISGLFTSTGETEEILSYDKSTGRIHQFDLKNFALKRSVPVSDSSLEHNVLGHPEGNYIMDFNTKGLTIFPKDLPSQSDIFDFQGTPVSAAYSSDSSFLILYDDLGSVGVISLAATGEVLRSWLGGPLVEGENQILAGDITAGGKLVLSFTNSTLGIVDLAASLEAQSWVVEYFDPAMEGIDWVAPIAGNSDLILVSNTTSAASINISNKTIIATETFESSGQVLRSKLSEAHYITWDYLTSEVKLWRLASDDSFSSQVISSDLQSSIVSSILDTTAGNITLAYLGWDDSYSYIRQRLSDNLAMGAGSLDSEALVGISPNYVFSHYPSKMGYVKIEEIGTDDSTQTLESFNLQFY